MYLKTNSQEVLNLAKFICSVLLFAGISSCQFESESKEVGKKEAVVQEEVKTEAVAKKPIIKKAPTGSYTAEVVPENMTVQEKKKRFKALIVPAVQKVYQELDARFEKVSGWLTEGSHQEEIAALKEEYKAETDQELLAALKPHPPSIVIAQAAMESAWGTSRFFVKAKNVFGVWSFDEDEPRMAAGEQRGDKIIWVKKYKTLEASVRDNYRVLARGFAHQHFRDARLETDNPYLLVMKLDRYSEMKEEYGKELASVISYNKFTEYDPVVYPKPKK